MTDRLRRRRAWLEIRFVDGLIDRTRTQRMGAAAKRGEEGEKYEAEIVKPGPYMRALTRDDLWRKQSSDHHPIYSEF